MPTNLLDANTEAEHVAVLELEHSSGCMLALEASRAANDSPTGTRESWDLCESESVAAPCGECAHHAQHFEVHTWLNAIATSIMI